MTYDGEVTNLWTFAEWWVALNVGVVAVTMCLTGLQLQVCNGSGPSSWLWNPPTFALSPCFHSLSQPKTELRGDWGMPVHGRPRTALIGNTGCGTPQWTCGSILRLKNSPEHLHQLQLPPSSGKEGTRLAPHSEGAPRLTCSPHFCKCFPYKVFANPTLGQELKWVVKVCRAIR